MPTISIPKWSACMTIGLHKGYSDEVIDLQKVKSLLREIQELQIEREQLYLSANVFLSDIVLSGQDEPHVNLGFMNYPKLPAAEAQLRAGVMEIAGFLMERLHQNRVVIAFDRELVMLEKDTCIDPKILNPAQ